MCVSFVLLVSAWTGFTGCQRDLSTAEGVVEEFLDQHYVEIDLIKSKEYTTGLAREKIDDQIRLTQGQAIDESTRKPRVYYTLLERRQSRTGVSFLYELTIRPDDAAEFRRRVRLNARQVGSNWRVSNFIEY